MATWRVEGNVKVLVITRAKTELSRSHLTPSGKRDEGNASSFFRRRTEHRAGKDGGKTKNTAGASTRFNPRRGTDGMRGRDGESRALCVDENEVPPRHWCAGGACQEQHSKSPSKRLKHETRREHETQGTYFRTSQKSRNSKKERTDG